jgi:hypothetical protein
MTARYGAVSPCVRMFVCRYVCVSICPYVRRVSICPCVRMSARVSKVMNASENEDKDRIGRRKEGGRKRRVGVGRRPFMM